MKARLYFDSRRTYRGADLNVLLGEVAIDWPRHRVLALLPGMAGSLMADDVTEPYTVLDECDLDEVLGHPAVR